MNEKDAQGSDEQREQQSGFSDPTANPDWTSPSGPPQSPPTEQIPQGDTQHLPQGPTESSDPSESSDPTASSTHGSSDGAEAGVPPIPPAPDRPSYDSPLVPPRPAGDPYAGSSAHPTNPYPTDPGLSDPYAAPPPPASDTWSQQQPSPYGQQQPYGAPPAYDPYAATGGQAQPGGYPAYAAPGDWQNPPAAYGAPPQSNTSALVLTIISGLLTVSCCLPMVVSLILGIVALNKNSTDPEGSRRLTKWGWVAFGVLLALSLIAVVTLVAFGVADGLSSDYGSNYEPTY